MPVTASRTFRISGNGSWLTLGDLRWLLRETGGMPDDTHVSSHITRGDRPWESDTLTLQVTNDDTGSHAVD